MNAAFPAAARVLFDEAPRYICLHGGRGSGKSWSIARALLLRAAAKPLRILCCRELQNSIAESVHKLLATQIDDLGLGDFYVVQQTTITGKNGSEFIFAGLKSNTTKIKSYESVDIAWCEEAQTISKASFDILVPTIRKPNSQIICSFNPLLEDDFIYQRFIKNPPDNAVVVRMNFDSNPWFGEPLLTEMKLMESEDPDAFSNVWLGNPRRTLSGAIYANELRALEVDGRITRVPYEPTKPVHVFFDLGWADATSIWFAQTIGFETRIIDHLRDNQKPLGFYQKAIQARGYVIGDCWLPHDARAKQLGTGRSVEELMRAAGFKTRIVPQLSVEDGINAVRTMFPNFYFDEAKCAEGLQSLRRYRYDVDPETGQFSKKPLHDDASHDADSLRYLAVAMREPTKMTIPKPTFRAPAGGAGAWMS